MLFHENRLLADDSHEISNLFFFFFGGGGGGKLGNMSQKLSSAAVVIGCFLAVVWVSLPGCSIYIDNKAK